MTYKTETHSHTDESSYCATIPAREMMRIYKERGYKTIIITPHYSRVYFSRITDDWQERIDYILLGYKTAKSMEEELDINVLMGIELNLIEDGNDYLIYGITEEFLRENVNLYSLTLDNLINICRENDFLITQPHPFRDNSELAPLEYQMPIEVFNGRCVLDARNDLALRYAKENNLIGVSGTDFHESADLEGGIITQTEIKTIEEFKEHILSNNFDIITSQ